MGPGNKLREKGDVEGDVQNASLDRFATIDIDDVRHSLESEERNPYGQRNEGDVEADPPHSIDDPQNERQILGHEKNQDVCRHRHGQERFRTSRPRFGSGYAESHKPVDQDGKNHHEDEARLAPRIEEQARHEQKHVLRTPAFPERHIVAGHHERQEGEQEYEAREKHASVESASPKRPAPSGGSTRSHRTKQPRRTVSKTYDTKTRIAENPFKPIAPISRAD